jgi:hypothetical protein
MFVEAINILKSMNKGGGVDPFTPFPDESEKIEPIDQEPVEATPTEEGTGSNKLLENTEAFIESLDPEPMFTAQENAENAVAARRRRDNPFTTTAGVGISDYMERSIHPNFAGPSWNPMTVARPSMISMNNEKK